MDSVSKDPASFRDPSGFLFRGPDGVLYRQVNRCYRDDYRALIDGGLYQELADRKLLIEHEEVSSSQAPGDRPPDDEAPEDRAYCVIRPRELDFISYAYEWPFSALKKAALMTLEIQQRALRSGMSLKDASHYNVQFEGTRPVFIDSLSFERHQPGAPWTAYRQFCQHFLAPLALMAKTDVGLNRLLLLHMDGVPLELASQLLPWRTRLRPSLLVHLHLHAKMLKRYSKTALDERSKGPAKGRRVSPTGLKALIENLAKTVSKLTWNPGGTEWADYYEATSYTSEAFAQKQRAVAALLDRLRPRTVWDLGANTGVFSRISADKGAATYAFDIDPACVEINFLQSQKEGRRNLLPLNLDLTNPSPAIGWAHRERRCLADRGPAELAMALALVHHLAISNNVPLGQIADFFHGLCRHLIIEFVPKHDPQVKRLLRSRKDVFDDYYREAFEAAFRRRFTVLQTDPLEEEGRVLYLMQARPDRQMPAT